MKRIEVELSKKQIESAKVKIRRHYKLQRLVTDDEVLTEVTCLKSKGGDYDDPHEHLAAALTTGLHPIDI